jgi:hypothetical protein
LLDPTVSDVMRAAARAPGANASRETMVKWSGEACAYGGCSVIFFGSKKRGAHMGLEFVF